MNHVHGLGRLSGLGLLWSRNRSVLVYLVVCVSVTQTGDGASVTRTLTCRAKTHTLSQRKSHVSKADRRSDKSAVAGTGVSHANQVLKFVLVPVGVVCFLGGCV